MTKHEIHTCDWPLEDDHGTCGAQTRESVGREGDEWLIIELPTRDRQDVKVAHLCPEHAPEVWGLFES